MKLRKNVVVYIITIGVILASCSSTKNNSLASNSSETTKNLGSPKQYFQYDNFDVRVINELNNDFNLQSFEQEEKIRLKKLRNNLKKISSKESFLLNLDKTNIHSLKVVELIYRLELPIRIKWSNEGKGIKFKDLLAETVPGFCSSLNQDAMDSLALEIARPDQKSMVIFMENYSLAVERLGELIPGIKFIKFDSNDPQDFAALVLGVNSSQKRFIKIKNLNPNQEFKFLPRSRDDIQKIILILEPSQYKSLLPALRYHGVSNFEYTNFVSVLENLNDTNQLLDFENTLIPISENIVEKIKAQKIRSLENITSNAILSDWLLIEIMNQSGIGSADISGMTGRLEFQKGRCAKRRVPLDMVDSKWISS